MDGLAVAMALATVVVVPLGLHHLDLSRARSSSGSGASGRFLRGAFVASLPAGLLAAASLLAEPGLLAAVLVLPWLAVGGAMATAAILGAWHRRGVRRRLRPGPDDAEAVALLFFLPSPTFLLADRLGISPFGIDAPCA